MMSLIFTVISFKIISIEIFYLQTTIYISLSLSLPLVVLFPGTGGYPHLPSGRSDWLHQCQALPWIVSLPFPELRVPDNNVFPPAHTYLCKSSSHTGGRHHTRHTLSSFLRRMIILPPYREPKRTGYKKLYQLFVEAYVVFLFFPILSTQATPIPLFLFVLSTSLYYPFSPTSLLQSHISSPPLPLLSLL